jgi:hypothetical protein
MTEIEAAKKYVPRYEIAPNPTEALCLLIIDSNSAFALSNSKYLPKFLKAVKAQETPTFYDKKITDCIKAMGWEKYAMNGQYCGAVDTRAATIDAVDIAGKHYTVAVTHNALQLRHFLQDHPNVKGEDIPPVLKPTLFFITPDVSDAKSNCSFGYVIMDKFDANGNQLGIIVGDGLPVQKETFELAEKPNNLRSVDPQAKKLPQYHVCLFHSCGLSVTHARNDNAVFQVFTKKQKKIIKILNRKRMQEYFKLKIPLLLKWRPLSTCDSLETLLRLRQPLQTLLDVEDSPASKIVPFEVANGLVGAGGEIVLKILYEMEDVEDALNVCGVSDGGC